MAGGGGKKVNKKRILELWNDHHVVFLEDLEGREKQIRNYLDQGITDFAVAGGDGTVNEVASVLMQTSARLGIIPSGSGNGLARDLGLPLDPDRALEAIRYGQVKAIDVGQLNGMPFFCTAGIGFDAVCAHDFAEGGHSRGLRNYVKVIFRNYFSYRPVEMVIRGEKQRLFSLTFANAGQFGNNAYIAPDARPDDGYLDCAMILPHSHWYGISLGWRLVRKTLGTFPYFKTYRFKECVLTDISDRRIHLDGEARMLNTNTIEVKVIEKALKVLTSNRNGGRI